MIDLTEEDLWEMADANPVDYQLSNEDLRSSQNVPIRISYEFVDLDSTNYHFRQEFMLRDTQRYFTLMKELSSSAIVDWIDYGQYENHFYRTDVRGNLKRELGKLDPDIVKANPLIFHFALYSDKGVVADRTKNIRSPRIYFMLGGYGVVYILFFDPFHEINPISGVSASV